jgi:protein phosphatase 1L
MQSLSAVLASKNAGGSGSTASTGGGTSEDETFSFGYSQMRGKRPSMEDFQDARIAKVGDQIIGLFGVFDGHGGSRAAEYVKQHLFGNLIAHPDFVTNPTNAITETFKTTDSDYLKSENGQNRDAGSTASTAILIGKRLLVANVGDSRAVIYRTNKDGVKEAVPLSKDHKPNRTDERERIEKMGGSVMWVGTWRVGGVLAVSRAFGDRVLKRYVVPDPDIEVR